MPWAPKRPCTWPGCGALTDTGRCPKHKRQERKEIDERRGTSTERGYDARWRKARRTYLIDHPFCAECGREGKVAAASVVDHRIPHRGDYAAFWDEDNWQSLCKTHHDSKTAKEDGRWG